MDECENPIRQGVAAGRPADTVNERVGARLRALRRARGLSLEALAARSGVSRSMISLVERAATSPTAVLLEKLSASLDVSLASLFEDPQRLPLPLARRRDQTSWQDPQSGYLRRNVSPTGPDVPVQIVEVEFPPSARLAYEAAPRSVRIHQQIWMLAGQMEIGQGEDCYRLATGDCLALELDQAVSFYNPSRRAARYAVILSGQSCLPLSTLEDR
ncbi:MAG: helix-turn-helix domain-containing protein [Gammaproteobacteria bacterium]|nr:helix-turn-helix domain-containing protein [Gammaproteobacteria bacterium]